MSRNPTRTFSANVGQLSTGQAGPDAIEADIDDLRAAFAEHKQVSDGDHDGRYYTEAELNAGQLDNRYYTEAETDTKLQAISQGAVADGSMTPAKLHKSFYYKQIYGVRWL